MEGEIIRAAMTQGLWAVLFVVMLFYVLKTSGEREKKLTDALNKLADQFGELRGVKEGVSRIERRLDGPVRQHGGVGE